MCHAPSFQRETSARSTQLNRGNDKRGANTHTHLHAHMHTEANTSLYTTSFTRCDLFYRPAMTTEHTQSRNCNSRCCFLLSRREQDAQASDSKARYFKKKKKKRKGGSRQTWRRRRMMVGKLRRSIWLSHRVSPGVKFHPWCLRREDSGEVTVHPSRTGNRGGQDAVKIRLHKKGTRSLSSPELNRRVTTTSDRSRADSHDSH